ncbi:MAG: hypothetical protein M3Q98_02140 [Actinomycetota bacterium]|nr:hypothetical protein [Actinomycetota bacterium]
MVYAYTQDVPIDLDTYDRIIENLGPEPLDGILLHLCVRRPDGGLRYIDVWESENKCAKAFDDRIHPAVDKAFDGQRPESEPFNEPLEVLQATGAVL